MAKNPTKRPWIDRDSLLGDIGKFVSKYGSFFEQNAKRMSDLFEMSVYNDFVRYYRSQKYQISIRNLEKNGSFRYKLSPAGLAENFSFFDVRKTVGRGKNKKTLEFEIHHNIKIQSAKDDHIYFTADVSVTVLDGVTTTNQNNNRRHSFVENKKLLTIGEAKNMNPFPEVLIGFTGIVLEFIPEFIEKKIQVSHASIHLSPSIVFSGSTSQHVQHVCNSLESRYGINVFTHLASNKGRILTFKNTNRFNHR